MPEFIVLGCSDAFNSGGRKHTSFLLKTGDSQVLIDCGANTALAFKQQGLNFQEVDCVILSHFHGDHYGGLPFLILEAAKVQKRKKPLLMVSPPGLKDKIFQLMKLLYPGSEDALEAFPIEYRTYEEGEPLELSFGRLQAYPVQHSPESLPHGLRLETQGKTFAFSGDTAWHENLLKIASEADLFICECNFFEEESPAHLCYQTIQDKGSQLNAKRIALTHLGDSMLAKKDQLKLEVLTEGMKILF